jgi:endoribonuclease LACTB2
MIEISDFGEVRQIKLASEIDGDPYYWVSSYLIDGLLIDTGCTKTLKDFSKFLETAKVDMAVNTHSHADHIGGNSMVREKVGCPIYASAFAIPAIKNPPKIPWYSEQAWGSAEPSDVEPLPEVIETRRFSFEVVETPGHSPDHVAFVERNQGWVFSGDLFIDRRLSVAGPDMNVSDMLASMKKLVDLMDDKSLLFTSLRTVRRDGRKTLQDFILRFEKLRENARNLRISGLDVREIVNQMFGGESMFAAVTNDLFSSSNLVRLLLED